MFLLPSKFQDDFNYAASAGETEKMRSLLNSNPEKIRLNFLNEKSESPLMMAAKNGRAKAVRFLLENGANTHLRNQESNFAAIHYAAYFGHLEVARALIDHDPEILNLTCVNNHTPLHIASENGRKSCAVADFLINAGANTNALTTEGNSPLILSLMHDSSEVSALLLQNENTEINLINNKGEAALHWAVKKNNQEIIYQLVSRGAETEALTNDGLSVRDFAQNDEVRNLLDFVNIPGAEGVEAASATRLSSKSAYR